MRCPRCRFDGASVNGGCSRCGYGSVNVSSGPVSGRNSGLRGGVQRSSPTMSLTLRRLMRGDVLRQGRYRLLEELMLPENQQGQGTAWLAVDAQSPSERVIIREVAFPRGTPADKGREVRSIATRLAELARYPGFPDLKDVFSEREDYYIVLEYPEGESLASVLKRQGGGLPEDAILTHDAVAAIIAAAGLVRGPLTGQAVRNALASLGTGDIPAFQGVSGRILFDMDGNPIDKAIVVLQVKQGSNGNEIDLIQVAGKFK